MAKTRAEIVAWESRWSTIAAVASFLLVAALIASQLTNSISGDGNAEVLRSVDVHRSSLVVSGILQALGFLLMLLPLCFLFRATQARNHLVRNQLIGLVVAAPIFLSLSAGLTISVRSEAADTFVAGEARSTLSVEEAKEDCDEERQDKGEEDFSDEFNPQNGETAQQACTQRKVEDKEASNAIADASLTGVVSGLGLAGGLGLVVTFLYTCLWAMRTGLLTRFWGSLGMVGGIAFILGPLFIVTLLWFLYFGLMLLGRVPGGRPPAWAAGEAVPWPTPGEKAAAEMEPSDPDAIDVDSAEVYGDDSPEPPAGGNNGQQRRKRKRRD